MRGASQSSARPAGAAGPEPKPAPEPPAAMAVPGDRSAEEVVGEYPFDLDRPPDDPGPLPPDEDDKPKRRFGLF